MNIFLIGYRGSGKTSVASALAGQLRWPWVDTDQEIEQRFGRTIREIFAQEGEPFFRDLESQVVAEVASRDRQVVALGGGAVLREANRRALAGRGKVVWLTASPQTLWQRIGQDPTTASRRPHLTAAGGLAEIEALLAQRHPLYAQCADLTLDTEGLTPDQIARQIAQQLRLEA